MSTFNIVTIKRYYLVILIISTSKLFGQVEFFDNKTGLSLGYQQLLGTDLLFDYFFGGSVYWKNGFSTELGVQKSEDLFIPTASVGIYGKQKENNNIARLSLGISYGFVNRCHLFSLNMIVYRCFYQKSLFPFLLNGSFSAQTGYVLKSKELIDLVPLVGLNYTQAFFAKSRVYPFLGLNGFYEFAEHTSFLTFLIGLNIKLGN